MGRVLRAIQASLVVVVATVTPAWADFDRNLDLTAPGGGLTPQSQWDPRWRDFGIGPLTVTLGECGCLVTNLATMMDYHIGGPGPGTSLPWFPVFHKNPATGGFDEDFVWSPAYIDLYLTSGPDPQRPRASGWGYKIGVPGRAGSGRTRRRSRGRPTLYATR